MMQFLTAEDFRPVADSRTLEVISQSDAVTAERSVQYAISEIGGYLRAAKSHQQATGITPTRVYDIDATFNAAGNDRNAQLVMYTVDVALYHLISWLPQKIGFEIREIRYRRALEWLQEVQKGTVLLDIPMAELPGAEEQAANSALKWGSESPATYDY
jgi:hypothetical protein